MTNPDRKVWWLPESLRNPDEKFGCCHVCGARDDGAICDQCDDADNFELDEDLAYERARDPVAA